MNQIKVKVLKGNNNNIYLLGMNNPKRGDLCCVEADTPFVMKYVEFRDGFHVLVNDENDERYFHHSITVSKLIASNVEELTDYPLISISLTDDLISGYNSDSFIYVCKNEVHNEYEEYKADEDKVYSYNKVKEFLTDLAIAIDDKYQFVTRDNYQGTEIVNDFIKKHL